MMIQQVIGFYWVAPQDLCPTRVQISKRTFALTDPTNNLLAGVLPTASERDRARVSVVSPCPDLAKCMTTPVGYASPSGFEPTACVPVPCASTYPVALISRFAISYVSRIRCSCASVLGDVKEDERPPS